jgi:choline dehydrogenase-like flavoprotein
MLERGGRFNAVGNTLAMVLMSKRFGLTMSREKNWVVSVHNYGGASNFSAGAAADPPASVFDPVGIDLASEVAWARRELKITPLPDELVGKSTLRILETANDLGYHWTKLDTFIDPETCREGCGDCMLGCRHDAKWTARVFGDEATTAGAKLLLHARVDRVLTEGGRAVGVEGSRFGRRMRWGAKAVVLSAALGSPVILKNSGIDRAGRGFACDFLSFVGGVVPGMNTHNANPMTVGTLEHYEEDGLIIVPVFPGWAAFAMQLLFMGPGYLSRFPNLWRYTGMMVKIKDEIAGTIHSDADFSKPITKRDKKRLDKGVDIISRVLRKMGAKDDSIFSLDPFGAHPSASCRIGEVVDANLETEIRNCFVCDSSVFPESLGLPVVLTAVSLGKRTADILEARLT